jgi:hypothetical protein
MVAPKTVTKEEPTASHLWGLSLNWLAEQVII